jgi:hypothetical protein
VPGEDDASTAHERLHSPPGVPLSTLPFVEGFPMTEVAAQRDCLPAATLAAVAEISLQVTLVGAFD